MNKYYNHIEKFKEVIIEELINELGYEYDEYIRKTLNNLNIVLESLPKYECLYAKNKCNTYEKINKRIKYLFFEIDKLRIFQKDIKCFFDEWIDIFISSPKKINYDKLYWLFGGYSLESGLIDYFNSVWENKINNEKIDEKALKNIKEKRNHFISYINKNNYEIKEINSKVVDAFILYRNKFMKKLMYKKLLLNRNSYISYISKLIGDDNPEAIIDVISSKEPKCLKYLKKDGSYNSVVYIPISKLKKYGIKNIDVILIHELIHFIQKFNENNNIINEIIVQYKALKITSKLRDRKVFIFDTENNSKINGECIYELLFMYINIILEYVPENLINNMIINSNYNSLNLIFGDNINNYYIILEKMYNEIIDNNGIFNSEYINEYNNCESYLLNYYFNVYNNKVKKRIIHK